MKTPYVIWYSLAVFLGGAIFGTWIKPEATSGFRGFCCVALLFIGAVALSFSAGRTVGERGPRE